ncbi:raffinose/stachyose/melibiose transport system permease protein [Anaerobacterium chartisolvens]|uniref:Raffinose/stachyose/melibiose transport system permease protein n=1 Tax=Anaerobacterium chartisolvens TaxID=1297424 RepID=A0A369B7S1_9FIRM|nr:carbohydrate ABC transporter permease [Anaerobacterium chartisolvens]RCX16596.1 raffinose/stachyose/melibiose transport system permease protein [Anaerobacterium chartisolvens]
MTGALKPLQGKKIKKVRLPGISQILLYAMLFAIAVIQLFPLYWMITFSLKSNSEIFGGNPVGLPGEWLWSNYSKAFIGGNVGQYFLNSVIVTGVTIVLTAAISLMASYALTRMVFKLKGRLNALFILGLTVPIHSALLPIFIMLRSFKLINSYAALIIPYTAFAIPMAILIFSGFMASVPRELEEAACIDGCSVYRIFYSIIFPLMKPAIATIAIFTFLQAWNELMFAVVFINDAKYKTLTVGIQSLAGQYTVEWGPMGAGLTVATIPTLIIYALMSKKVQDSLVVGAVKG